MSARKNGRTWADLFSENQSAIRLFIIILLLFVGYLVFNKWTMIYGNIKLIPPDTKDTIATTDTRNTGIAKPTQESFQRKRSNTGERYPVSEPTSNIAREDESVIYKSSMKGKVVDLNNHPIINARITCDNCLTSDDPKFSDEYGGFIISYQLRYFANEFPTKSIEFTIFYNGINYSASQSISQNSINIELK